MSYDVAAGWREADEDAPDIDQDIRSIMVANDNLVEQLAESVARGGRKNSDPRREEEAYGYENAAMDKLSRLVRETMMSGAGAGQDNHRARANRLNQSSSEAAAAAAADAPLDLIEAPRRLAKDPSPSGARDQRQQINRERRPQKFYANCADLAAECEAGGQCALEPQDNGAGIERRRARCRCPIGRGGVLCEKPVQRALPNFLGHSYLALPLAGRLNSMRLVFRPAFRPPRNKHHQRKRQQQQQLRRQRRQQNDDDDDDETQEQRAQRSLLLYSAGEFALFLVDNSRVELQYLSSDSRRRLTRVMGSRDVSLGEWNELTVVDALAHSDAGAAAAEEISNNIGANDDDYDEDCDAGERANRRDMNRIALVMPNEIGLQLDPASAANNTSQQQQLFVAGLPESLWLVAGDSKRAENHNNNNIEPHHHNWRRRRLNIELADGFRGCISELSINGRAYNFRSDLNGDALDGFDVVECCSRT